MNRQDNPARTKPEKPGMREILSSLSRYALTPLSLINTFAGTVYIAVLMAHVLMYSDGGLVIFPGGRYDVVNVFTPGRLVTYWIFFPIILCLAAALYCYCAYIRRGKFGFLGAAALFVAAACLLLRFIPFYHDHGGFSMWESILTKPLVKQGLLPSNTYRSYLSFLKLYPLALSLILTGAAAILKCLSLRAGGSKHQADTDPSEKIK